MGIILIILMKMINEKKETIKGKRRKYRIHRRVKNTNEFGQREQ